MIYRCAGCGETGIAPGVCDRCHFEYLPDAADLLASLPHQACRRPWRHFANSNATTAFTDIQINDRWPDAAIFLIQVVSFVVLGGLLLLPLTQIPSGYRVLMAVLPTLWFLATTILHALLWSRLTTLLCHYPYLTFASIVMSERAIRASSRFTPIAAAAEGPAVFIGETTAVETVPREGADSVLAVQGFEATGTLADDPTLQYDGAGPRMRPSIGGDFLLADESGPPILVRAEHVVIESPRLDLSVPVGSRVAAAGNVVWVATEEGYRGGHGHWEMVGTWDQPIILRVLRAGPPPAAAPSGIRLDTATTATSQAPEVASTLANDEAIQRPVDRTGTDTRRG